MAEEENQQSQEKTEEPSEERRQSFRERGEVAHSRELSAAFAFIACLMFLSATWLYGWQNLASITRTHFEYSAFLRLDTHNFGGYLKPLGITLLQLCLPLSIIAATTSGLVTFGQTKFNFSTKRLAPQFKRLNPLSGLKRMVSGQSLLELLKSIGKMLAIGSVGYLILLSEWGEMSGLLFVALEHSPIYGSELIYLLFTSVAALLILIAGVDYLFTYLRLEKQMRMSRQDIKEEQKQREISPLLKNRLRRLQREYAMRKNLKQTTEATVVITNPTHYAVALKYEWGMPAPIVLCKGVDILALRMREIAKQHEIPIVENKALARSLYRDAEENQEIPAQFYKAVSEVISYVFRLQEK